MRLPPGVSATDFSAALRQFEQAVGRDWLFTSEEDLATYRDAYSPFRGEAEERLVSAAVAPDSVERVQQVVRIANRYRIPLYAISTGKNLGYGGSAPNLSGSVVVDLKRMNRVLEVDEKQASCLVEPGVSYFDMYRHLQASKSKLWLDVPDPGWGSMVGNALDRGGGYTMPQFRNHFDAHCGMEIVLPNGELMRTGMGAMPNAKTWQQYKSGFGPWIDGMFSQSNFGIVTKMGFWLMPEPEAYLKATVFAPRMGDLDALVDEMSRLESSRIFNGFPDLSSPMLGSPAIADLEHLLAKGPPPIPPEHMALLMKGAPPAEMERYAQASGTPFWSCNFTFYGPEAVVRAQWAHVQERMRSVIPGAGFRENAFFKLPLTEAQKETAHYTEFGIPSLKLFSVGARSAWNPTPSRGHMWFSPIIPRTAQAVMQINTVMREAAQRLGIPLVMGFTMPAGFWERAFVYIIGFSVGDDVAANKKNRASFRELIRIAADQGWGEYRTPPAFQDDVMATYSFNDHALRRFHETVKDAIDPNGILSPGRYGVWPKRWRHLRGKSK